MLGGAVLFYKCRASLVNSTFLRSICLPLHLLRKGSLAPLQQARSEPSCGAVAAAAVATMLAFLPPLQRLVPPSMQQLYGASDVGFMLDTPELKDLAGEWVMSGS